MKKKIVAVVLVIAVFASLAAAEMLVLRARGNAEMTHVDEDGRIVISGIDVSGGIRFDGNSGYGRAEPVTLTKGAELFDIDFAGLHYNEEDYSLVLNVRSKSNEQEYLYGGYKARNDTGEIYRSWPRGVCERLDINGNTIEERDITVDTLMLFLVSAETQIQGADIKPSGESCRVAVAIPFSETGVYRMKLYFFEYFPENLPYNQIGNRYEEVSFMVTIEPQRADVELLGGWTTYTDDGSLLTSLLIFRGDEEIEIVDARCSNPQYQVFVHELFGSMPSATVFWFFSSPFLNIHQSPQADVELTFSRSNGDTFDVTVTFGQDPADPKI